MSYYPVATGVEELGRLLPLRGDGCGDHDCLVSGLGMGENAIVFWDHEVYDGPAYLLAGSLDSYLNFWSDKLIFNFFPNGERTPQTISPSLNRHPWIGEAKIVHPWPFDEEWLKVNDSRAKELLADPIIRSWLLEQEQ